MAGSAGKATTLSSTITSGSTSPMISTRRSSTCLAPSTSAPKVGAMNPSSCSIVGRRKTGEVSRMKSFQNWPGSSSSSLRGRLQPHQPLLEALLLERAGEGLLDDEDDAVPAPAQHVADPDAVVGRSEGALGEEDEGLAHRSQSRRRS